MIVFLFFFRFLAVAVAVVADCTQRPNGFSVSSSYFSAKKFRAIFDYNNPVNSGKKRHPRNSAMWFVFLFSHSTTIRSTAKVCGIGKKIPYSAVHTWFANSKFFKFLNSDPLINRNLLSYFGQLAFKLPLWSMIIYAYHNKKPVNRAKRKMRNSVDYLMLLNTHPPTAAALVVVSDHCTCCYHCSIKKKKKKFIQFCRPIPIFFFSCCCCPLLLLPLGWLRSGPTKHLPFAGPEIISGSLTGRTWWPLIIQSVFFRSKTRKYTKCRCFI